MTQTEAARFEAALLRAYLEAARVDPAMPLFPAEGPYCHLVIEPADSAFAGWLVERGIAVVADAGVAIPHGGTPVQTLAFGHALLAIVRVSTRVMSGARPPDEHLAAIEELRARYGLPTNVFAGAVKD
ncbi:hypothetical protein [Thermomonospora umbrina]|uniref:Uncharacterized protein n=1 Tax=Thermomonospora umbrina TaxID=111806 RepID=A0A3D9SXC1_9ACTN|nr:hypothetical protein [Thermomonospora umbrina]REF00610.1 hypothetical protein DFJ69_6165 [Thermomonospora umbrina]